MRSYAGVQKHLVAFLVAFIGLSGWLSILYPPIRTYAQANNASFWDIVYQCASIENNIYPGDPFFGWIFLVSSVILAFLVPISGLRALSGALHYLDLSERDISILQTNLTVRFEDNSLCVARVSREQLFHANVRGVEAYNFEHIISSSDGEIVPNSFDTYSMINNELITKELIIREQSKKLEATEVFYRPLPYSVMTTYLPDAMVLFIYNITNIFDHVVVERTGSLKNRNEYNGKDPIIQLTTNKYSAKNVTVRLDFPSVNCPADPSPCII
jgi:hypothetical protein